MNRGAAHDVLTNVRLRVLGSVEALDPDGGPVRLGDLQRVLLASLLARAGSVVSIDQLVDLVWGERLPADPEAGLHSQVSRLRRTLLAAGHEGKVEILTRPPGYALSVAPGQIDAQRFDEMVAAARIAPPDGAADLLEEALGLWRGRAYGDFADHEVARFEAIRLEETRLVAFDTWAAALLECGRIADALPALESFVAEHPLREESRMTLMRALCAAGRHADALAGYRRYRDVLAAELGLDPSESMQQLELQILRRELPGTAGDARVPEQRPPFEQSTPAGDPGPAAGLPTPLTTFVGRAAERQSLAAVLREHRMVSAVGPGGVGKTRLALAVAADIRDRFAGGVHFIDLVPVTDPSMIASAVAAALGLGQQQARSAEDALVGWLSGRECLLVLDNCEHVMDGVGALVERLLASCAGLVVLTTTRARLQLPFEWVFPVPGLSVSDGAAAGAASRDEDGSEGGDAITLFRTRAAAAGRPLSAADLSRVAAICRGLDGIALAIELAAARLPSVGLDGLEAGLADRLRLLTGGPRVDDRHRSLRSTLDWSCALLSDLERAVLRRISVFAAPFTVEAAGAVVGDWGPVSCADVVAGLAGLVDHNLLTATTDRIGTRYRALETIRQYGSELLVGAGEQAEAAARHLRWCRQVGAGLAADPNPESLSWLLTFDQVADDLRSALAWARAESEHRTDAFELAITLAELTFTRGMPEESQRRYQQAARCTESDAVAAGALRRAAAVALSRHVGDEGLRLLRLSADAALRAGDRAGAARDLAKKAEVLCRGPGMLATIHSAAVVDKLLAEARPLAKGDFAAEAQVLVAEAFRLPDLDPLCTEVTDLALDLARRGGDPLIESAALDQRTSTQLAGGDIRGAAATSLRRTRLLAPLRVRAEVGMELSDAFHMAAECAMAAGDLAGARKLAEGACDLPFHREVGHLATSRLIVVTILAGAFEEAVALGERFRDGWERAGRPRAGNHGVSAYALATVHGLRGDDEAKATWLDLVAGLQTPGCPPSEQHFSEFFDAWLLLHRDRAAEAVTLMQTPPEQLKTWYDGRWRPWYAALWAEAAVLSGHPEAVERVRRARRLTEHNPIADAIVDRAEALESGERAGLLVAADALAGAGCRYQWARTLVLAGGREAAEGRAAMAWMGVTPMPNQWSEMADVIDLRERSVRFS